MNLPGNSNKVRKHAKFLEFLSEFITELETVSPCYDLQSSGLFSFKFVHVAIKVISFYGGTGVN